MSHGNAISSLNNTFQTLDKAMKSHSLIKKHLAYEVSLSVSWAQIK